MLIVCQKKFTKNKKRNIISVLILNIFILTKNIQSLREEKKLTQNEVAKHLWITRQTFSKLEKWALELTLWQAVKLSEFLWVDIDNFIKTDLKTETANKTDWEKYKQIIQFFIENGTEKGWEIPKTKLAKLCYLADFAWYYLNLESLTWLKYKKLDQWPVPDEFFRIVDELENKEAVSLSLKWKAHLYSNISSVKTDRLILEEKSLLEKIAKKWKNANTKDIVDFTHKQFPWKICYDKEIIPYGLITQEDPHNVY